MNEYLRVQELRENLMELTERINQSQSYFELRGTLFEGILSQKKADAACRELDDFYTEYFDNVREVTVIAIPSSGERGMGYKSEGAELLGHYSLIYANERAVADSALKSFQTAIAGYRQMVVNRRIQLFSLFAILLSAAALLH